MIQEEAYEYTLADVCPDGGNLASCIADLNTLAGDGTDSIYVMDQIKDKKNSDENWAENITISEAMKKLKEKERNIINKRFFEGRTQMEVAEEIGISQAQVSRLEKSAINHIRRIYK